MKYILLSISLLFFSTIFSQESLKQKSKDNDAAVFLDLKQITARKLEGINPKDIENVKVEKGDTLINGRKFNGKIFVTLSKKKDYSFLSLTEIKDRYTDVKSNEVLYMLNGNFIKESETNYFIEKSYFHKAISQTKYNPYLKEKGVEIINILTKTPENLNPKIILRGEEN